MIYLKTMACFINLHDFWPLLPVVLIWHFSSALSGSPAWAAEQCNEYMLPSISHPHCTQDFFTTFMWCRLFLASFQKSCAMNCAISALSTSWQLSPHHSETLINSKGKELFSLRVHHHSQKRQLADQLVHQWFPQWILCSWNTNLQTNDSYLLILVFSESIILC